MADNADRADAQNEIYMDALLHNLKARPVRECLELCADCDEPIPAARREALKGQGCTLCIGCQVINDQRKVALYG